MNLNVLHNIYQKSLFENEKQTIFWENYLRDLNALDFKIYSDKLTVPALVPIGSRIFFRGELKHTSEVTVSLGADYFVKCSIAQAEILRDRRIKDAKSKIDLLNNEKEYLENQISFSKQSVHENAGQDIIEVCTEEEDKAWRQAHRERVRQHMQNKDKPEEQSDMTDEDLWNRLEELELEEELKNELSNIETSTIDDDKVEKLSPNEIANDNLDTDNDSNDNSENEDDQPMPPEDLSRKFRLINDLYKKSSNVRNESKMDLLHQIIERRKLVVETLTKLKRKDKTVCKNEDELVSRLDEMEEIDELEDEMERLEEIINETESVEILEESEEEDESEDSEYKVKKCVSFADEDSSDTIEITFKHSHTEPINDPYDPEKGILKPSDVFEAFSSKQPETCSILKKTKYPIPIDNEVQPKPNVPEEDKRPQDSDTRKTIIVKDVVEKQDENDGTSNDSVRPMSLFKKKRLQQKS